MFTAYLYKRSVNPNGVVYWTLERHADGTVVERKIDTAFGADAQRIADTFAIRGEGSVWIVAMLDPAEEV